MTVAFASDQRLENGAEQLESLRRQMALLSEKVSGGPSRSGDLVPAGPVSLPPGTVGVLSGARSLLLSMVASVTAAGGNAAIVGQPDIGLLAAVEMGADLSRLAVIPDPGTDPVEVAAVLIDGMDLVVLGLGGRRVTRARARAVVARARQKAAPCWSPTATGKACRRGLRPGSAAMRSPRPSGACPPRGWGGSVGCGCRSTGVDGDGLRSRAGDLVYGLARGRGGRGRGPIRDGPGRGHVGKPGDRLLGDRAGGRGAPRVAASGGGGAVSATVYSDCRRRPRRPALRRGDRGGRRSGAPRRAAAARAPGVAGARAGPFFGSEQMAAERLIDAVAAAGAECQVGIADRLSTAVFAARAGRIVEPGGDARFLSLLSIRQLATEPSLSGPGRDDLTDLLWRMGIRTIGQFAALSRTDVASRFGADAVAAHRFARGEPERAPCGREPPPDLAAELACDPPIDRVDAAAFAGRSLAAELHRALMAAGVGCTRLAIHAVTANGEERSRVWRCAEPLTEDATADRVRWQLDGWLNNRNARDRPTAAVTLLRLQAVETVSASEGLQLPLWGGLGEQDRLRARRALVRVQGLLGPEAVRVPVLSGGHGPAERITLTVLGLVAPEPVPQADPGQPWPGRLPDPSPAVLFDDPVDLLDAQGNPIRVTSRGMFSADPARLRVRGRDDRLRWWAGPWPDDERWWDPDRASGRTARAQVLLDGDPGTALLLCYRQRRWYLEGSYE